jgi:hypothetical protein
VGESLSYEPEIDVSKKDYTYVLKVRLNRLAMFGTYDVNLNTLLIVGNEVTEQDVGVYSISFVAEFSKDDKFIRK